MSEPFLIRPKEADYISHVAYTRALEAYCGTLEHAIRQCIDAGVLSSDPTPLFKREKQNENQQGI